MKRKTIIGLSVTSGIVVILAIGSLIFLSSYYKAKNVDNYLTSTDNVEVSKNNKFITFDYKNSDEYAFIFYPGAKVDEKAYAPIASLVAEQGIDVYVAKFPFHYAVFNTYVANEIRNKDDHTKYYIGGHSLGGAIAGTYLSKSKNPYDGLILLASFTSSNITDREDLKVLSLYGSNDGVLNRNKYEKYKKNLPDSLEEHIIEGGNHAQFGSYGKQNFDSDATISADEQWNITADYIVNFIKK